MEKRVFIRTVNEAEAIPLLAVEVRCRPRKGHFPQPLTERPTGINKEDIVEFVMFEDVDGMEVFVNPERVIWVREYPNHTTVISCGHEDRFAVRLAPAQAVAVLGKMVR